eukprot:1781587-Rhodomonas_salina.1
MRLRLHSYSAPLCAYAVSSTLLRYAPTPSLVLCSAMRLRHASTQLPSAPTPVLSPAIMSLRQR